MGVGSLILISGQQHGFMSKRSCMTKLLSVMDDWADHDALEKVVTQLML